MNIRRLFCVVATAVVTGCGGAQSQPGVNSDSYESTLSPGSAGAVTTGPRLSDVEFTTEVDKASMTAAAPVSTEFMPSTPEMFFIGRLEGLSSESEIEVRWTRATQGEPFHATRSVGSGRFTVMSRLSPEREALSPGEYWVVVLVDGSVVGKRAFKIVERRSGGMLSVKELKVALAVDDKQRAVSPSSSLPKGSRKIHASFFLSGVEPGASIRVSWYRDEALIDENDIECTGEKRYSTALERKKALPIGDYAVEVEVLGEMLARRSFYVGDSSGSPVIEKAALGIKLGKNRIPSPARQSFNPGTRSIRCGIQFAFVPEGSKVEVKWISLDGGETVLHISEVGIKKGGPSTVDLVWKPGKKLSSGAYKAEIAVNSVNRLSLPFTIK